VVHTDLWHAVKLIRLRIAAAAATLLLPSLLRAHDVPAGDRGYILETPGVLVGPFMYLGAKHMVTGLDHVLFLLGVIFWLYRARDVALYVTLFAIGHSITLLLGTQFGVSVNEQLIDAIIGASVAWKAAENLGWLRRLFDRQSDARIATLVFGLFHGLGLATRLQSFALEPASRLVNLVAFNIGVEMGQLCALGAMLLCILWWRTRPSFAQQATRLNAAVFLAGLWLAGAQVSGYIQSRLS
jgi:hypothetical protein